MVDAQGGLLASVNEVADPACPFARVLRDELDLIKKARVAREVVVPSPRMCWHCRPARNGRCSRRPNKRLKVTADHARVQRTIVVPLVIVAAAFAEWVYRMPSLFINHWLIAPTIALGTFFILAWLSDFPGCFVS
jgi:hypothetical protein